jgi:hypothetical protein
LELQILVRGQSNAILFAEGDRYAALGRLTSEVQRLLGFDGVADTVKILYARGEDQRGTAHGSSAFLGDWMARDPDGAWVPTSKELGLLRSVAELDSPAAPATTVLWLHSEYDSFRAGLDAGEWMSAVRQDAALLRGALGGDAATVPYHFVSAHPFGAGTPQGHQTIRLGMERWRPTRPSTPGSRPARSTRTRRWTTSTGTGARSSTAGPTSRRRTG